MIPPQSTIRNPQSVVAPADQPRRTGITDNQRRALFAWAAEHGKTHDDLRAMTPKGSISMLSFMEAHRLLNELNGRANQRGGPHEPRVASGGDAGRPHKPRAAKGVCRILSPEQFALIEDLAKQLREHYRWTVRDFDAWLSKRHHKDGRPMTTIESSRDGVAVIQVLTHTLRQAREAKAHAEAARARAAEIAAPVPEVRSAFPVPSSEFTSHRRQRIAATSATS